MIGETWIDLGFLPSPANCNHEKKSAKGELVRPNEFLTLAPLGSRVFVFLGVPPPDAGGYDERLARDTCFVGRQRR